METKSRYEVINEMEDKKRQMIVERDGFDDLLAQKKKQIKQFERTLEDAKEELDEFVKTKEAKTDTLNELIKSIDESLQRLSSQKK